MRIAFYAPLKPPDHPAPSGDRMMARLLMKALSGSGHTVELASRFRSYDGEGDVVRQQRIRRVGGGLARRLLRRCRLRPADERPDLWFTYHLYHKAPDWLGPEVTAGLGIPYVIAEASHAPKREGGPWDLGCQAAAGAIARADRVISLNQTDDACLLPLVAGPERLAYLKPFIEAAPFREACPGRDSSRRALMREYGLADSEPWLLTVAMMRPGDKLASYRVLGNALAKLHGRPWRLLVVGSGPAEEEVRRALRDIDGRVCWLGQRRPEELPALYAACDLYLWPAVNEAYGMSFLEAQAGGLPVVAGSTGGVPDVVCEGETGFLVEVGDAEAFAQAVARLLDDPGMRRSMGRKAKLRVMNDHDIPAASRVLDSLLRDLVR